MSASEALNHEEFWPGYCEGITRILLCLLGTYPDHRKRKLNGKKKSHYDLRNDRTLQYSRNREQRLHRLCWTAPGILDLGSIPTQLLHEFRDEVGSEAPVTEFLTWFKQHFAEDYLKVF